MESNLRHDHSNNLVATVVGLIVSLTGITLAGKIVSYLNLFENDFLKQVVFSDFRKWLIVGVLIIIMKSFEQLELKSIGFKKTNIKSLFQVSLLGILAVILGIVSLMVAYTVIGLEHPETMNQVGRLPIYIQLFTITTAAITEEILYRGYPIERIIGFTGNKLIAGFISFIVFLLIHFPSWGISGAIPQIIFSIFLVGWYLKNRNVVECIIMHWIINFLMIIVLPNLII